MPLSDTNQNESFCERGQKLKSQEFWNFVNKMISLGAKKMSSHTNLNTITLTNAIWTEGMKLG